VDEPTAPVAAPSSRFDQLAKVVLVLALLVVALAAGLVLPATAQEAPDRLAVALVAVVLSTALPALALFGLLTRAPWRRPVASTALWFLVLSGVLETVVGTSTGQVRIPFLAIAAVFVLVDRAPRRVEGHRGIRALAVGLGVAGLVWYLVGISLVSPT
jgi:hypothetical protein